MTSNNGDNPVIVTKARACELLGLTDGQIRSKIQRCWTRGFHYGIIDQRTWVHLGRVEEWLIREGFDRTTDEFRSPGPTEVDATTKRWISGQMRLT